MDIQPEKIEGKNELTKTATLASTIEAKGHMQYRNRVGDAIDTTTIQPGTDKVYEAKIALLNQALLDLGMGKYQWLLAFLTGFGWYIDNVRSPSIRRVL